MSTTHRQQVIQRFMKHVEIQSSGCWLWKGLHCKNGYGHYQLRKPKKRVITAHRFSYLLFVEKSVDLNDLRKIAHLTLDHTCQVHDCVCPYHLDAVPRWVNELRGMVNQMLKNRGVVNQEMVERIRQKFAERMVA
jgi:hypothetical protein